METDAQLWKFVSAWNGGYYVRSRLGTVIDIANGTIQNGTNIQDAYVELSNAEKCGSLNPLQ